MQILATPNARPTFRMQAKKAVNFSGKPQMPAARSVSFTPLPNTAQMLPMLGNVRFGGHTTPSKAPKDNSIVENLHGYEVSDPFRPLEDLDAAATLKWAKAQNERTQAYLKPADNVRQEAIKWQQEIRDYDRETTMPIKYGDNSFYKLQKGLDPQPLHMVKAGNGEPKVLLDPNTLSGEGTVAIQSMKPRPDGKVVAYSIADAGSDKSIVRFRDVETGKDLDEEMTGLRQPYIYWDRDGKGFTYDRQLNDEGKPDPDGSRSAIYHHTMGQPMSSDPKVFDKPDVENASIYAYRLDKDDDVMLSTVREGTDRNVGLYFRKDGDKEFSEILPPGVAAITPSFVKGDTLYAVTSLDAPTGRLVAIDLKNPAPANWKTVVAEDQDPGRKLDAAFEANGKFYLAWTDGGANVIESYTMDGKPQGKIPTPVGSSIKVGQIEKGAKEFMLSVNNYLSPDTRYKYDTETGKLELVQKSNIKHDLTDVAKVERLFATSKDGTKVPMWVISPKDAPKDGSNAVQLYGYGGFSAGMSPGFSFDIAQWVEQGGTYVVANLRGGDELGQEWYDGGRLENKQNVFDDFAACAKELIKQGYTKPERLAISGGSNGGLLTATTSQQNPDLFGAVVSRVPVTDVLRFHTQGGYAPYWKSDYGDPEVKEDFEVARKYSPVHNVAAKKDVDYPPTLITTADHDDRVAPWHAYKLAATLQDKGHDNTYLRVESDAGHGAGKPTEKQIQEGADVYAFLVRNLGALRGKTESKEY